MIKNCLFKKRQWGCWCDVRSLLVCQSIFDLFDNIGCRRSLGSTPTKKSLRQTLTCCLYFVHNNLNPTTRQFNNAHSTHGVIALGFLTLRDFDFETERLYVAFPDREVRTQIYIMIGLQHLGGEEKKKII